MSFRYRTVGYSPEYAVTIGADNEFHNISTFKATSTVVVESGSSITINAGGDLIVTDAPVNPTDVANKAYADLMLPLTGGTMTGAIVLPANPTANLEAATKQYADLMLPLAGGTMSGDITVPSGQKITITDAPAVGTDAANKTYVDSFVPLAGGTMTGTLVLDDHPITSHDAATKAYVDGKLGTFDAGAGLTLTTGTVNKFGTWSQSGSPTIVISITSHGYSVGTAIYIDFTTGTGATTATYLVDTVTDQNTFTVLSSNTGNTSSGNVTTSLNNNTVDVVSTTLDVQADSVDLAQTNPKLNDNATNADTNAWYDQVKIDQYGRVSQVQNIQRPTENEGWYNKFFLSSNKVITQVEAVDYLTENQTITLTGGDVEGTGSTTINANLSTIPGLSEGTYTKVSVNARGRVTSAGQLTAADVTSALGYTPPSSSNTEFMTLSGSFEASTWGTAPINMNKTSGNITGSSISGTFVYIPKGIYHITFYGNNNWWSLYYKNWWYYWSWWSSYWQYYYQPAAIYLNNDIETAAFANYGGWWWYWNSKFKSEKAQDFCINETLEVTSDNSYFQFGLPLMAGTSYNYNVKILKVG